MSTTRAGVALAHWLKREKARTAAKPKAERVTQEWLAARLSEAIDREIFQGTISAYIKGKYAPKSIALRKAFQRICKINPEWWDEPADEAPAATGKAA